MRRMLSLVIRPDSIRHRAKDSMSALCIKNVHSDSWPPGLGWNHQEVLLLLGQRKFLLHRVSCLFFLSDAFTFSMNSLQQPETFHSGSVSVPVRSTFAG